MKEEVKRPLIVKLIIALIIYQLIMIVINMALGNFGVIGWLVIPAVYFGLWKMKRDWMYLLVFLMSTSQIVNVYLILSTIFTDFNYFYFIDFAVIILNVLSISWLLFNRDLFTKSEKKSNSINKKEKNIKKKPWWYWAILVFFVLGWLSQLPIALSYIFGGNIGGGIGYLLGATAVLAIVYYGLNWYTTD